MTHREREVMNKSKTAVVLYGMVVFAVVVGFTLYAFGGRFWARVTLSDYYDGIVGRLGLDRDGSDPVEIHPAIIEGLRRLEARLNQSEARLSECFELARNTPELHDRIMLIEIKNNEVFYTKPNGFFVRHERLVSYLQNILRWALIPDMMFYVEVLDARHCHHASLPKSCAVPIFTHEAGIASDCFGVLIPPRDTVTPSIYEKCSNTPRLPWEAKKSKAVWRGSTTNTVWTMSNYNETVRYKLVEKSSEYPDILDAKLTAFVQSEDWALRDLLAQQNYLSSFYTLRLADFWKYKYLVVVDGNTNADRMGCYMFSESVILRTPILGDETFYTRMKPGVHFIPVKEDLSDLISQIQWAIEHDEEAKKIALEASKFIQRPENAWTPDGAELYWAQLLQEYAVFYNKFY